MTLELIDKNTDLQVSVDTHDPTIINSIRQEATVVIEAGHYYMAKGPTIWSKIGWDIAKNLSNDETQTMLFIDDVHSLDDMSDIEKQAETPPFSMDPDHIIYESAVLDDALSALEQLKSLSRKKKAKFNDNHNQWFCSNVSLTHDGGYPTCILLDVGLTLKKEDMGYTEAINILPEFYKDQQMKVKRLVEKIRPEFKFSTLLFNEEGQYYEL